MTEDVKQPVVDTPAAAAPAATATDARKGDDLDSLLSQWDTQTAKPAPVSPPPQNDIQSLKSDIESVKSFASTWMQEKYRTDISATINEIRGDVPKELVDDEMAEAWLDAKARSKPALQNAWMERAANPQRWNAVKAELGKELARKYAKQPDKNLTEDTAAVAALVRGASSTKAPTDAAPNFGVMSNAEYRNEIRKNYGFDPGV